MDPAKLWYTLSFAVFIGVVYRPLLRFIVPALDRYRDSVAQRITESRTLRDDAQRLVAQYSEELRDMEQTRQDMLQKAKHDITLIRAQMTRQHEQDIKIMHRTRGQQEQQAARRSQDELEQYILLFIVTTITHLMAKHPELQSAYQQKCVQKLSQLSKNDLRVTGDGLQVTGYR